MLLVVLLFVFQQLLLAICKIMCRRKYYLCLLAFPSLARIGHKNSLIEKILVTSYQPMENVKPQNTDVNTD